MECVRVNLKKILTVISATSDISWPGKTFLLHDPTVAAFWQPEDWSCSQVESAPMAELGHLQTKSVFWNDGKLKGVFSTV